MAERKTVFISCGQWSDEERNLGKEASNLVEQLTPYKGYFAQDQTTLKALSENVLRRLYDCVGLIVIMHHRGKIEGRDTIRASVWIEQEIAMATFMEQVLGRPLYVALFIQKGIGLEGLRQSIQLNPTIEFTKSEEVIAALLKILPTWEAPLYISDEERRKIADSVLLSIKTDNGNHHHYTIQIENHTSKINLEVRWISLWGRDKSGEYQKIGKPAFPPDGTHWIVERTLPIQFDAKEDVAMSLWKLAGSPRLQQRIDEEGYVRLPGQFDATVRVELECEIMGIKRSFEEIGKVQVDFVNRQIRGL
jgi:hypothetical protein